MKNLLTILATIMLFVACENKPVNQLPPATQEGNNTIGALINGKVYSTYHDPNQNSISCHNRCEFNEGGLNGQYIALVCVKTTDMETCIFIFMMS